ncbi:heme-binding protein 2-like [Pecten maximus]|uniref:heme-binding protein 2-like n=1 Tax=Pecten maximus TaxID=6579 RepID=UPI001458BA90|nr:heme-binding protein 2-like [Pecten maximus]XP_033750771.1 heme-binding protein 2-like [Pecten maximus]
MDGTLIVSSIILTMMTFSGNYASTIPHLGSSCHSPVICPSYTVIRGKSTNDYEYRRYDESKWIATNYVALAMTPGDELDMRMRLKGYYLGGNTEGVSIDQTLPVILRVAPNMAPNGTVFVMLQMIPSTVHGNIPTPTAESVYIQEVPPFNVYVRRFVGCSLHSTCQHEVDILKNAIGNLSKYYQEYFLLAEFESSTDVVHNEAWLISTEHVL